MPRESVGTGIPPVTLFLVHIREEKKSRRYVLDMQARLHFAAKTFTANIGDIRTAEMDKYTASRKPASGRPGPSGRSVP